MSDTAEKQPQRLGAYRERHKDDMTKGNSFSINPLLIRVEEGFNVRVEDTEEFEEYIESLTHAYMNDNFVPHIVVQMREGEPTIVDGHCRYKAILRAMERGKDIERIPVVEYHGDSELDRQMMLITTNAGRSLSPTEEARVYQRLVSQGYTIKEIAEKADKKQTYVKQRLEVDELPAQLKRYIDEDRIAYTLALKLYKEYGTKATEVVAETIARQEAIAEEVVKHDASGDTKKAEKKPKVKVTEGKIAGHRKISAADNRMIRNTLSTIADNLVSDPQRVKYVNSRSQVDVSFTEEEFLQFSQLMETVRRYNIEDRKADGEEIGDEDRNRQVGPEAQEAIFAANS